MEEFDPQQQQAGGSPKKHKLTRREKKERYRAQQAYEKQLVEEGKLSPRVKYMPRSIFWNILAVCLAFFLGIAATIGGLLGFGLYTANNTPVKDLLGTVGVDYDKYVEEEYANMSILDLAQEISGDLSGGTPLSLSTFAKYSPFVREQVDTLAKSVADVGVYLNVDELMAQPFTQLGSYFSESVIPAIEPGAVLKLTPQSDPMMIALCYGKEGVDYKIEGDKIVPLESSEKYPITVEQLRDDATGAILSMELGTLLKADASSDPLFLAMCYGEEGVDYKIENGAIVQIEGGKTPTTLDDLMSNGSGVVSELTVEAVFSVSAQSDEALRYLAYGSEDIHYVIENKGTPEAKVVMLTDAATGKPYAKRTINALEADAVLDNARIRDLVHVSNNASALLKAIQDWQVLDLSDQSKLETLRVSDALGIDAGAMGLMGALRDWTLADLKNQNRIERLKLSQVLTIDENSSALMQAIADWRVSDLTDQSKLDTITLSSVIVADASTPKFLQALLDAPIGGVGNKVDSLRLADIMSEEDIAGNVILNKLKSSTINSLARDLAALSVRDVFADEIYSYVRGEKGSYAAMLKEYAYHAESGVLGKDDKTNSALRPVAITAPIVETRYYLTAAPQTQVYAGLYVQRAGEYVPVAEKDVYSRDDGTRYVRTEVKVLPTYAWTEFNYETGASTPIAGSVGGEADATGLTLVDLKREGDVAYEENGAACYYIDSAAGAYYPLLEDAYSVFYLTQGADEQLTRHDLDREIAGYRYEAGGEVASDTPVYHHAATATAAAYDYVYVEEDVVDGYSETSTGRATRLHTAADVTERWFATWDGQTTPVEVDRYLSSTWYLLFGGEEYDAQSNTLTVLDKTDTSILDLAKLMSTTTSHINSLQLWALYFHEFIDANPYQEVTLLMPIKDNLNELTVTETVELVQQLLKNP